MDRNILIREIVSFCLEYGILLDEKEIGRKIEQGLERAELVESIINMIFKRAKSGNMKDIERVKELLIELEKIRLDLEFRDYDTAS